MELEKNVSVDTPIDESRPVLQFQYNYRFGFPVIAQAFL